MTPELFALRIAAAEWLREHPENPNAGAVRAALLRTNPPEPTVRPEVKSK